MHTDTLLITGGAGFIGGTLVRQLLREPQPPKIVNLDLLTYAGNLESLADIQDHPQHVFVRGDIRDGALLRRLFREHRPRAVIHLAAESHVDRSIEGPARFIETNIAGTFELLRAALAYWEDLPERDAFRFLHVSTDEVFGSLGPAGKFCESTPYAPRSPYSASKAAADHIVRAWHHTYGLPVLLTNCSNNYGPYQFPEKLIPLMILNALERKRLPVYGDGQNIRDWLHVEDHCRALQTVLARGRVGETYTIGGNSERTNLEVVQRICQAVDQLAPPSAGPPRSELIQFVTDRPGHDRRYAIDASKIEHELGWKPSKTFEEGIVETVRWYLTQGDWVNRVSSGKYRRERLGLLEKSKPSSADSATPSTAENIPAKYVDGPIDGVVFQSLKPFQDPRGWLIELFRHDELLTENHPVMAYVSETAPGVGRGPHEHVAQADYFAFLGPGEFELRLWDTRCDSPTCGNKLAVRVGESNQTAVIVPPGVVHGYRNIGDSPGWVFNAPNQLYAGHGKQEPVDEIRHEEQAGSPFSLY